MLKWLWESLFFIKIILIFDFFLFHKDKKFGQNYIPQKIFIILSNILQSEQNRRNHTEHVHRTRKDPFCTESRKVP